MMPRPLQIKKELIPFMPELHPNKQIDLIFSNGIRVETIPLGMLGTNCYFLVNQKNKSSLIIDPGGESSRILHLHEKMGITPEMILLTHGHYDHIGALADLVKQTDAKVFIHNDDAEMLSDNHQSLACLLGLSMEPVEPDGLLREGSDLIFSDLRIRILHTPGHTPGSVCFLIEHILFAGDTLFRNSIGRSDFPGSSTEDLFLSIRDKLLTLPDETIVLSGHGMHTTVGHERKHNPFFTNASLF